jgi:hypothetical protein
MMRVWVLLNRSHFLISNACSCTFLFIFLEYIWNYCPRGGTLGIVSRRTDATGEIAPYGGQAKSEARYFQIFPDAG